MNSSIDVPAAKPPASGQTTGCSLSGEIVKRVNNSLAEDGVRPEVLRLEGEIPTLIDLVEMQCGPPVEPAPAPAMLQLVISSLLARYGDREDLKIAPGELPDVRVVAAGMDDPGAMAIDIESVIDIRRSTVK